MRVVARGVILLIAAVAAGCSSNPTGPSSTSAAIAGTVHTASSARAATNATGVSLATTVIKVTVKGTSNSTTTTSNGNFMLTDVPAGNVTLVFEGSGVNAQLPLGAVKPGDRVTITVTVNGSDASLEDREDDNDDEQGEQEGDDVEGKISGLTNPTANCPSLSFMVGSTKVTTNGNTKFEDVKCVNLANGMKVEAKGTFAGGVLTATKIEKD